jgi:hypothetical protein
LTEPTDLLPDEKRDKPYGLDRDVLVSAAHFASVLPFVGTEPTRYYLTGVFIEPVADGGVRCVATDGHLLAVAYDPEGHANGRWICPVPKSVKSALRKTTLEAGTKSKAARYVAFSGLGMHVLSPAYSLETDPQIIDEAHIVSAFSPPVDGTFPNWQVIWPKDVDARTPDPAVAYNGEHLKIFEGVGKQFNGKVATAVSLQTGSFDAPVIVHLSGVTEWVGLIMPMQAEVCLATPDYVLSAPAAA